MSIVDNHLYAQNEESDKESSMKSDTENDTESDMESDVESGAESSMENSAEEEIENKICADGAGRKHKDSHSNACKKKSSSHFSSKRMEISRHSLQLAMGAVELLGEIKDFVPYVGPAFKIVYSILGIVKVYQGAEVAKTTTDTLIDIQGKLTTVIEDLKKIPGRTVLQGRVDEYYSQIKVSAKLCSEVTPELRKRVLNDLFVKLWYLDDRIVQEGLETSFWLKSLFTSQDSPDESSSTNFDPNWGFEAIHTKFLKVFVQQQKAISVLKFYDIEPKAVQSFDLRLKKQLHLFWKMCEAEWNKEVGVLQQAQHEMNYHKNHAIVFATETKTSTFLTTLSGPDKAISLQKVDLRSNFNEINDGLRFEHHEMSMKFENWSFGLISEDKQLLPENLSSINKCRQIVCHKQFFCILHHKPTQITIADLKNSTNKTHLLRKGMNIQLFAIANDHIYILHLEGDDSNIYQIGSINKFFSPGALHLWIIIKKCKVRAMAGHGTCLYILHGTTIEVYDTVQGQVKAEWPNEGSRDPLQKILKESKDKSVFLLNVGSSLCLRVIEKNKTQFYFIKPFWPNMLPQLDISGKCINSFKNAQT